MAVSEWTFVYADRNSFPQGEILNASARKVSKPLNSLDTASFQVRLDNPLANDLASLRGFVKAYRRGVLQFHGLLLSAEENISQESGTLAVNCIDCGWLLNKRWAGKTKAGTAFAAGITKGQLMSTIMLIMASEGPYGVDAETYEINSAGSVLPATTVGPYKNTFELLKEMSAGTDGFDWRFLPYENFIDGEVFISSYNDPYKSTFWPSTVIGTQQANAVFEFGVGRNNVLSYKRTISREAQANKVYNNAGAGPDAPGYPTVSALDASSITDWYLMEDLVSADLINSAARQTLVNAHRDVRKEPRQVIEFQPHLDDGTGRVPQYGIDFDLGDQVRGRFAYNGKLRLDAWVRLHGVSFDIDDTGTERTTFTLTPEA